VHWPASPRVTIEQYPQVQQAAVRKDRPLHGTAIHGRLFEFGNKVYMNSPVLAAWFDSRIAPMTSRVLLAMLLSAMVAGCVSSPEERQAADEAKCRSYGFLHRNDAFAACLQRIDLERRAMLRRDASFDEWRRPLVVYRAGSLPQS
jgi:hypothetical protein